MKNLLFLLIVFFLIIKTNKIIAQDCTPLPAMFVDRVSTNERVGEFYRAVPSKYNKLIKKIPQNFTMNYTRKAVDDLIDSINKKDGISIYLARYNPCNGFTLPTAIKENQLIVLFATEDHSVNPVKYYFINENDDKLYIVSKECAEAWRNDFFDSDQPGLRETIDPKDKDNADSKSPVGYSDTRYIFYKKRDISEAFTNEEIYQQNNHHVQITGYQLSFSAYTKTGNGKISRPYYKNRLIIQIDYLYNDSNNKQKILDLEDQEEFDCRLDSAIIKQQQNNEIIKAKKLTKQQLKKMSRNAKLKIKSNDNGQLCPTYCPHG
jgi:hypothetical protein